MSYDWAYGDQEEEERCFDHMSEEQMCLEEARIDCNRHPDHKENIRRLTELGKWVIVEEHLWHCKATDAVVGSKQWLYGFYITEEEARAVMLERGLRLFDGEDGFYVAGPLVKPMLQSVVPDFDDETPF